MSSASEGRFLTTEPPGKSSCCVVLFLYFLGPQWSHLKIGGNNSLCFMGLWCVHYMRKSLWGAWRGIGAPETVAPGPVWIPLTPLQLPPAAVPPGLQDARSWPSLFQVSGPC